MPLSRLHLLSLKRLPISLPEFGGRFIGFLEEAQEELVRVGRLTNRVVRQDELPKALVVEVLSRAQRRVAKAGRLGIGIDVERRPAVTAVARPEPAAADLVRAGFGDDPRSNVGGSATRRWRRAAREP